VLQAMFGSSPYSHAPAEGVPQGVPGVGAVGGQPGATKSQQLEVQVGGEIAASELPPKIPIWASRRLPASAVPCGWGSTGSVSIWLPHPATATNASAQFQTRIPELSKESGARTSLAGRLPEATCGTNRLPPWAASLVLAPPVPAPCGESEK
jgi:hypothetical protein